jgi:hypothetical protein
MIENCLDSTQLKISQTLSHNDRALAPYHPFSGEVSVDLGSSMTEKAISCGDSGIPAMLPPSKYVSSSHS